MSETATEMKRLHVPRFSAALKERAEEFRRTQRDATYWRYSIGVLPKVIERLMDHPELLDALAADARALKDAEPKP